MPLRIKWCIRQKCWCTLVLWLGTLLYGEDCCPLISIVLVHPQDSYEFVSYIKVNSDRVYIACDFLFRLIKKMFVFKLLYNDSKASSSAGIRLFVVYSLHTY